MDIFSLELKTFQIFLIALFRVGAIFVFSPIFGATNVPRRVKFFSTVCLAGVLYSTISAVEFTIPIDSWSYAIVLGRELLVGLLIGYCSMLVMQVLQFSGKLLDMGMGMHMARVIDPLSRQQASVVGQLLYVFAIFILLSINGHHQIITAVARSYDIVPINGIVIGGSLIKVLAHLFMQIFIVGFQLAIPIAGILFVITFCLGVMAKAVPQMNVFFVGIPLKILVGLLLLMIMMKEMVPVISSLISGMLRDMMTVVSAMSG